MNIPPLGFTLQDSGQPIPSLNSSLLVGSCAELVSNFPVEPQDFVNISMISSIPGGTHHQSFDIGASAPMLRTVVPADIVKRSSGKTVQLLLRVLRAGKSSPALDATVFIDGGSVVVPTPGTRWTFDTDLEGWVPQGNYTGGIVHVRNQRVEVDLLNSQAGRSHVITRSVAVTAGRRYQCSFGASTGLPSADGSRLGLTVDGAPIGPSTPVLPGGISLGHGAFTASRDRVVLGIINESVPRGRHQVFLDNIFLIEDSAP